MALWKGKAEHTGHKGSTRKNGYWGTRADAKRASKKLRRIIDRKEAKSD